ncbi:MAG: 3-phosphoglycerate dehydrogenase [Lachnospiraceae bacterium]|nr:3-phosphoglycerate dehydrogenase [Lachnospiraceae bacterium]
MYTYNCLNKISEVGIKTFDDKYTQVDDVNAADAILVRSAAMHDMDFSDKLLAVARAGAGVNNIPLDKCAEKGIVVFNTPGANANGVKELVIAGLLLASRDIVGGVEWVKENHSLEDIAKQVEKAKSVFAGKEIYGKKLGVIGLGAIGVLVANAAESLGMEVYGYDPYVSVQNAWKLSRKVKYVKTLEEIYRDCDYITVHVPLMDSTKGMINMEAISLMKQGVVILNFARDLLVNEKDMGIALESGKVARYVSDFPNPTTANMKGVILIPHLGASTEESEDNCAKMAVCELKDYLENGNITNSVNYPAIDAGVCQTAARVLILHKNIPNMIAQFSTVFSSSGINIENLINKSRGEFACSVLDVAEVNDKIVSEINSIESVLKVRVIK